MKAYEEKLVEAEVRHASGAKPWDGVHRFAAKQDNRTGMVSFRAPNFGCSRDYQLPRSENGRWGSVAGALSMFLVEHGCRLVTSKTVFNSGRSWGPEVTPATV